MPILDVEHVGPIDPPLKEGLAQRIADVVGAIIGSPPRSVWVRVRELPIQDYAENGGKDPDVYPVFVTVLRATRPEGPALAQDALRLAEALAGVTGRPVDDIHIVYEASGAGRVAFGGRLRT